MLKKLLVLVIIFLFIGMSVVSSTENIVEDANNYNVKEIASLTVGSNRRFYGVDCSGYPSNSRFIWFDPENPGVFNDIGPWPNTQFPQGGTFVEDTWWVCDTNGNIWTVDEETGEYEYVGNSGTGELVGLAYHEKTKTTYGMSTTNLYTIDMDDGHATLVGSLGTSPDLMISLDCDKEGTMYGCAIDYYLDYAMFYEIDLNDGHATQIGIGIVGTGMALAYDYDNEIMYACILKYDGFYPWGLWTVDLETGEFTYKGPLYGQVTCFAIPYTYKNQKPTAPIVTGPTYGNIGVVYEWTFLSTDPEDDNLTYYVDWGDVCGGAEWHGSYPSGEEVTLSHMYTYQNSFIINTLAVDEHGAESDWTYYGVTMPKYKMLCNSLFLWLFDRFPLLQKSLDILVRFF